MTATRRLAAILAADVVGYSRLMGEDEAGTARAVGERRETSARPESPNDERDPAPCRKARGQLRRIGEKKRERVRRTTFLTVALFAIAFGLPCVQAMADTLIRGHFSERHYLMEGEGGPVVWDWDSTLTLSGKNSIHEQWNGHNQRNLQKSNTHDYTLGSAAGSVEWRVRAANKLQKTVNFRQHTMTLTVETSGKECHLDVGYRLKPGFKDMYTPRADTGEWTHFSLPQTIETSCTIE